MVKLNPYLLAWPQGGRLALKGTPETRLLMVPLKDGAALLTLAEGDPVELADQLTALGVSDASELVAAAIDAGVLVEQPSNHQEWVLGPVAAAFMHGYHSDNFVDEERESLLIRQFLPNQPPLVASHMQGRQEIALPLPDLDNRLFEILAQRRSRRNMAAEGSLCLEDLAGLLFAGTGVVRYQALDGRGRLPFGPSPSPGALNTYDAYVISSRVDGLEQASYKYLPDDHTLEQVRLGHWSFVELFGGQAWCENVCAAIILVAQLSRQTWKYRHPHALGAVLVEAGHRAQNILLVAEQLGLAAVPLGLRGVGAYSRRITKEALGLTESWDVFPVHGVVLGVVDPLGDPLAYEVVVQKKTDQIKTAD